MRRGFVARRSEASGGRKREQRPKRADERRITHLLNHPVRLDAFLATFEAMASPIEVARLLRKPISDVAFHMSELRREGVIDLVKRAQRRGAVEHYYKASEPPEIDEAEWRAMPKSARRRIVAVGLQVVIADALSALRQGRFEDDEDMYLVWMPLRLRQAGQDAVTALQAEMLERMTAIKEEHGIPDGEETGQTMKVAVMLWFERGIPGLRRPRDIPDLSDLDKG
jgi:DNA-binding transcriptional ArsR family regulator